MFSLSYLTLTNLIHLIGEEHAFLKRYVGDWPIKEYLKSHFRNQRSYKRCKGKGKAVEKDGDFDSSVDANDDDEEF